MKLSHPPFVILYILVLFLRLNSATMNKYILQSPLIYHNCQPSEITRDIKGSDIIIGKVQSQTISLKIQGWFLLRSIDSLYRTIISIHSGNTIIVDLSYNIQQMQVFFLVTNKTILDATIIKKNEWFFISIQIKKDLPSNQLKGLVSFFSRTNAKTLTNDQSLTEINFDVENLIFNLGSPSDSLNMIASCAFSKDVILYQNYPFVDEDSSDIMKASYSIETKLLYFFTFDSIDLTPNLLQSLSQKRDYADSIGPAQNPILNSNDFKKQSLRIPVINLFELGSVIITFDAFLNNIQPGGNCKIATIKLTANASSQNQNIYIEFDSSNNIVINSTQIPSTHILTTEWTQLSISINNLIQPNWSAWVDDDVITYIQQDSLTTQYSFVESIFGHEFNDCQMKINNIKVYAGNKMQNMGGCLFQVGDEKQECLRCMNGYLLDENENSMTCKNASSVTPSLINYKAEYPRVKCPKNMYSLNSECKCLKGFYLENTKCARCPTYCPDCTSPNSCNNNSYSRDSEGKCINNTIDDGFSCVQPAQPFNFKETTILNYPSFDYDVTCSLTKSSSEFTFSNSQLKLSQSDSFFYSFTFKLKEYFSISPLSIFKIENEEIFTITISKETLTSPPTYYLNILFKGIQKFKLQVQYTLTTWVGVWSNFVDHYFLVHFDGQTIYRKLSQQVTFTNFMPSLCVGPCRSIYATNYLCALLDPLPLLFIKGIPDPVEVGIERLFLYHSYDQKMITKYTYNPKQTDQTNVIDSQNIPTQYLKFGLPYPQFHNLKGIGFSDKSNGIIYILNSSKGLIIFQCSIQVDLIESQFKLLNYQIDSTPKQTVTYYLIPDEFNRYASFRICLNDHCKDSKHAKIEVGTPTHLIIIPKNKAPYENTIILIEFEIVCNNQNESLTMLHQQFIDLTQFAKNIEFSQTPNTHKHLFYLNHIKFYKSGSFSQIDQVQSNPCLVYMNINPQICIQPKQGHYIYSNQVITYEQCQDLNEFSQYFYIANPYSQECEITDIEIRKCKEIDYNGSAYYCKKCKDPYAIPDSNPSKSFQCNQCIDGTFYSSSLDKCLICHNKCSKCSKTFDNCTECAHDGQLIPSCQCEDPHYYLETDYSCQQCEDKCRTCEQLKTYCIICGENRIYPPLCSCKPGYIENPVTKQCDEIVCDKKCSTCYDKPSTCDICAQNRIEAPDCKCGVNYFEDKNGNCQLCPTSTFYQAATQSCQKCSDICGECQDQQDKCTSCKDGFVLQGTTCHCSGNTTAYANKQGELKCLNNMDFSFEIRLNKSIYQLIFIFEEELLDIDFKKYEIKDILSIYLSMTPNTAYQIANPQIIGKEFIVDLLILKNIQTQQGNINFHLNHIFVSTSEEYSLDQKYTQIPLNFQIGPFIFTEDVLVNKQIDSINEIIKNTNQNLLDFVQKFQFVFYFLNTLQPTMSFFLLNLHFPPNLYKFYQIIGSFIFSKVPDYQSFPAQKQYQIFNYQFNSTEVKPANKFSNFGFSDCLIVNIPIILFKFGIIIISLAIGLILTEICVSHKIKEIGKKIKKIVIERLNQENEVNILILILTIMIQLTSVNQNSFMNRFSLYSCGILIIIMISSLIFNIYEVNKASQSESEYCLLFTERLQSKKGVFERNYFIFQLLKKYCTFVTLLTLQSFPLYTCAFNGIIFLVSSISTMILKPYHTKLARGIKILGDFIVSILWFLHIVIVQMEVSLYKNNILEDDIIQKYLLIGNIIIISLLIYNSIYFLDFILRTIQSIKNMKKPKQEQQLLKQQKEVKESLVLPLQYQQFTNYKKNFKQYKIKKVKQFQFNMQQTKQYQK